MKKTSWRHVTSTSKGLLNQKRSNTWVHSHHSNKCTTNQKRTKLIAKCADAILNALNNTMIPGCFAA